MSTDPTNLARHPAAHPGRFALIPHHRPRAPNAPPRAAERERLHAPQLQHGLDAGDGGGIQAGRNAASPTDPHPHGARLSDAHQIRPLVAETLLVRRSPSLRRDPRTPPETLPGHGLQAGLRHDRVVLLHHRAPAG